MANWYFYDNYGYKIGPIKGRELKQLAQEGTITPETRVEDENGRTALAKNITGLPFYEAKESESNPFSGDMSSVVAPPPPDQPIPSPFSLPPSPPPPPPLSSPFAVPTSPPPYNGGMQPGYQNQGYNPPGEKSPGIFDIRFTRFITNVWISVIWVIIIVAHFFTYLCVIFGMLISVGMAAQQGGEDTFAGAMMVSLVMFLPVTVGLILSLLFWRMALELIIVIFRIETNTRPIQQIETHMQTFKEQRE